MRILLLGAGSSASINFIKALKLTNKKYYIVGVDRNKFYLEMSPVNKRYLIERKSGDINQYIQKLVKIIKDERIDFVHAQPDAEVKSLSDYRDLMPTKTFLPTKSAIDIFQDKLLTHNSLSRKGVPVPQTIQITNENVLRKVFKPKQIIWLRAKTGAGGKASLPTKNYKHAKMWIDYWMNRGLQMSDFLASEYLPGKEVSWLSVWKDGQLICSQQKERIEWVQQGIAPSNVAGTTAIQKTVHYDLYNKIATDTILAVEDKPNGIYTVDMKENKNKVPCVTEINPGRFFTTSLFYATAGVNMPDIFVSLGLGLPVKKTKPYNCVKENIYWIRVPDGGPTMIKGEHWSYNTL